MPLTREHPSLAIKWGVWSELPHHLILNISSYTETELPYPSLISYFMILAQVKRDGGFLGGYCGSGRSVKSSRDDALDNVVENYNPSYYQQRFQRIQSSGYLCRKLFSAIRRFLFTLRLLPLQGPTFLFVHTYGASTLLSPRVTDLWHQWI